MANWVVSLGLNSSLHIHFSFSVFPLVFSLWIGFVDFDFTSEKVSKVYFFSPGVYRKRKSALNPLINFSTSSLGTSSLERELLFW